MFNGLEYNLKERCLSKHNKMTQTDTKINAYFRKRNTNLTAFVPKNKNNQTIL